MIKTASKLKKEKVPRQALHFNEPAIINLKDSENEQRKAEMAVYSGKKMDHWFWGDMIIDVEGIQFNGSRHPILEDHDTARKIGFTDKVDTEGRVFFPEINLLDNAHANEFYDNAKQGFPYQASISIRPTLVERVEKGEKVEVNGEKLPGPLTVFRKSNFREGSVCVFGVDSKTSSTVFSDEDMADIQYDVVSFSEENNEKPNTTEETIMTLNELKEKYPELVSQIEDSVKGSFSTVIEDKDKEISDLTSKITSLSSEKEEAEKRIVDLEKKESMRTEKELAATANSIFDTKLSDSKLPQRLYEKVKKHVTYNDFIADSKLNVEDFSKEVDSEIADWEKSFDFAETSPIKGVSTKKVDNNDTDCSEDVDRLFGHLNIATGKE